jgi:plastocyanin
MRKKHVGAGLAPALLATCLLATLTILFAACGGNTNTSNTAQNAVHMNDSNFVQSSITIKKGTSLTLVNDTAAVHIIANGTWDSNGTPKVNTEKGAPKVDAEIDGGASKTFGPFNTAGTFQLYCTIHPGMSLTVIVK